MNMRYSWRRGVGYSDHHRGKAHVPLHLQDVDLLEEEVAVIVAEHLGSVQKNPEALGVTHDGYLKQTS